MDYFLILALLSAQLSLPVDTIMTAQKYSAQFDVPFELVTTVIVAESNGNNQAYNKRSKASCMMQVMPKEVIRGRPSSKQLRQSVDVCIRTGVSILSGVMKNKKAKHFCDYVVGYVWGPKAIGKVSQNTPEMKRIKKVYKQLWEKELTCLKNSGAIR